MEVVGVQRRSGQRWNEQKEEEVVVRMMMEEKERVIEEVEEREDKLRYIPPTLRAEHEENEV